ncbi:MAG: hypothetical protein AAF702_32940 [Chloroflexota bacterium]
MAYMGRKQFEAQLIAAEVGRMLGGTQSRPAGSEGTDVIGRAPNGDKIVHGDTMLKELGFM